MASREMRVWGIIGQKGGSGKTTLALQLSTLAQSLERDATLLDLDQQQSAVIWFGKRTQLLGDDGLAAASAPPEALERLIEKAEQLATKLVVIDTAPVIDQTMMWAARHSDILIVPTRIEEVDRESLKQTLAAVDSLSATDRTAVVLNHIDAKQKDAAAETREIASDFGVHTLNGVLEYHVDLSQSLASGKGVAEFRKSRRSYKQVKAIYDELVAFDGSRTRRKR